MSHKPLERLQFDYVNWKLEKYTYVVDFDRGPNPGIHFRPYEGKLYLSGELVTRDGDPRPEMEPTRRRSFKVEAMMNIKPIERDE